MTYCQLVDKFRLGKDFAFVFGKNALTFAQNVCKSANTCVPCDHRYNKEVFPYGPFRRNDLLIPLEVRLRGGHPRESRRPHARHSYDTM